MSFEAFGGAWTAAGLALIAGVLVLLQRLRVRHREVRVATTLFWHEAVEETRARVLVERFRHPLAYLLALAIGAALWLGAAQPELEDSEARDVLICLDGSARMSDQRFDAALTALADAARRAPRDVTTVLWCGASVRTLLAPGEDVRLLRARLDGHGPEPAPPSLERAIESVVASHDTARALEVWVVGDAPVRDALLALLPENIDVARPPLVGAEERGENRGVIALGVGPASSGDWDRVDVVAEVAGPTANVVASLDGAPVTFSAREAGPERRRIELRDLPASGGALRIVLEGSDALPFDDAAERVLPNRPRLRVRLSAGAPDVLRTVLAADRAIVLVDENPDVVVRRTDEDVDASVPALELAPASAQSDAFLVTGPLDAGPLRTGSDDPESALIRSALIRSVVELGLDRIDATSLAAAADVTIRAGFREAEDGQRGVAVWEELFGDGFDFVHSRSFPLFIGASMRWLASVEPYPAVLAAGRAMEGVDALGGPRGEAFESVGSDVRPPYAGRYSNGDETVSVALLDASAFDVVPSVGSDTGTLAAAGGFDPVALAALLALLLLLLDGVLFRTGRTP